MNIDDKEGIEDIKSIVCDDHYFYILANKKNKVIGMYLLMINMKHPEETPQYLINVEDKALINDVDITFIHYHSHNHLIASYN